MAIICLETCYVSNSEGEVTVYAPGPVPGKTSKWLLTLKPTQRVKFEYVRGGGPRVEFTDDQVRFMFDSYLAEGGNEPATVAAFMAEYGKAHPVGSVQCKVRRISVKDPSKKSDTRWVSDRQIDTMAALIWG